MPGVTSLFGLGGVVRTLFSPLRTSLTRRASAFPFDFLILLEVIRTDQFYNLIMKSDAILRGYVLRSRLNPFVASTVQLLAFLFLAHGSFLLLLELAEVFHVFDPHIHYHPLP
ncbi:hypothetical protein LR48_Vigan05g119200 [Vigna angularis]|uniref:Uncharacterized protein n=1 Tax=Phaseolus angularis TaxID=3914 RepID=A0A0L9UM06_PHAAN|nr:hypothetical protein LR48_Vigan05g119200 [Vigna angularis]